LCDEGVEERGSANPTWIWDFFCGEEEGLGKGRNPQTGKEIKISANKVAKFKGGKLLRSAVK